ncbi:hypothetical protein BC832DRAFT_538663 [Gaertneriomyces semiglobifer]|nr:hypothetical protein BC832DRAFT_538663 [Gaertneriomyces semiglobifer]
MASGTVKDVKSLAELCLVKLLCQRNGCIANPLLEDEILVVLEHGTRTAGPLVSALVDRLVERRVLKCKTLNLDGNDSKVYWIGAFSTTTEAMNDTVTRRVVQPSMTPPSAINAPLTPLPPTPVSKRPLHSATPETTPVSKRFKAFKSPLKARNFLPLSPMPTPIKLHSASIPPPAQSPTRTPQKRVSAVHKPFKSPFAKPHAAAVPSEPLSPRVGALGVAYDDETQTLINEKAAVEKQILEAELRNRRLKLLQSHMEKNEAETLDSLTNKWRTAAREALTRLRNSMGPTIVPFETINNSHVPWGWDDHDTSGARTSLQTSSSHTEEPRLLTMKEICASMNIDVAALGDWDDWRD